MDADELQHALGHFTGSTEYTRLYPFLLLTDGARFFAKEGKSYWLMDVFASYLCGIDGNAESFTCLKLTKHGESATVVIDDGNGHVLAQQEIEYTDFLLESITLYGCWQDEYWVVMLPNEY